MKSVKHKHKRDLDKRKSEDKALERISREENEHMHGMLDDTRYTSTHESVQPHASMSERTIERKQAHAYYVPMFGHERTSIDEEARNVPEHKLVGGRVPAKTWDASGDRFMGDIIRAIEALENSDMIAPRGSVSDKGLEIAPATEADVWSENAFAPTGEGYKVFIESMKDNRNGMAQHVYIAPDKVRATMSLTDKPVKELDHNHIDPTVRAFRRDLAELRKSWMPSKQSQPVVLPVSRLEQLPRELWLEFSLKYLGF